MLLQYDVKNEREREVRLMCDMFLMSFLRKIQPCFFDKIQQKSNLRIDLLYYASSVKSLIFLQGLDFIRTRFNELSPLFGKVPVLFSHIL